MSTSIHHELAPGVTARTIQQFTTTADLADLLRAATREEQTVTPFGGRHSLTTGNPAPLADIGLDLTPNSGVLAYEPADLTLSVRTGTTWAELQSILAEQGQELPLDVPHPTTTTVGGVVATGFAGARRYRQGTLRDLLIGCEYVRGDGLAAKAGGMVVKNVSGFEIPRFLHGSWGSLAVITSVNLKVMPKPRADASSVITFDNSEDALAAALEIAATRQPLDAIGVVLGAGAPTVAVRATGRARAVTEILAAVTSPTLSTARRLDQDESAAWWQEITDSFAGSAGGLGVAMTVGIDRLATLSQELEALLPGASLLIMPGYGSIRLNAPIMEDEDVASPLASIQDLAKKHEAHYIVESAPPDLRNVIPAWGHPGDDYPTMMSVKQSFDPGYTLNRGRLFI